MKTTDERIVSHNDEVDLTKASLSSQLSSTGLDTDTQLFHVTTDRVLFEKPLEIVKKVLESNGYALNIENILACFDSIIVAAKVKLSNKVSPIATSIAREFIPCLEFSLPTKGKMGYLLKKFYDEIDRYESEISQIRENQGRNDDPENLDTDFIAEIKKKDRIISDLKKEIEATSKQLNQVHKQQASTERALVSQNILPPELRLATVREIDLKDRIIYLKSGRTSFNVSMQLLRALPKIEDKCLAKVEAGHVKELYFYQNPGIPFVKRPAIVVFASPEICKVRDSLRKTRILKAKTSLEGQFFKDLRRGHQLILCLMQDHIIRLEKTESPPRGWWDKAMREKIEISASHHRQKERQIQIQKELKREID